MTAVAYTIPADTKGRGSPVHDNVGRTVIYNTSGEMMGAKPAVVLAQSGQLCDLAVFTYDFQTVTVLGAVMIGGRPEKTGDRRENTCWLVEPR